LNWWLSTGTVTFQGQPTEANKLASAFNSTFQADEPSGQVQSCEPREFTLLQRENAMLKERLANVMVEFEMLKIATSCK
jgi:hypothetical protein